MHFLTRQRPHPHPERGSALIVALVFAAVIAISIGSFLQISTSASRLSYRTHHLGVAMNIAETGLEQAMWEMNRPAGWEGWETPPSGPANARRRTFDLGSVEGGATAVVKVYAQEKSGSNQAYVVARAIVSPPQGAPIEKWVKVTLDKKSALGIGGLGRRGITGHGNNVEMGSWNSDPDKDPSTPPIPFSEAVMRDKMSLATTSFDSSLQGGNADIYGKAAVGAASTDAIHVGEQGLLGPFGTQMGVKDPNSISANFSADLPIIDAPSANYIGLGTITAAKTLPETGHMPNDDGIYYYEATEINMNGAALTIKPGYEVVMKLTKPTGNTITLGGNGEAIQVSSTLVTNTTTGATTYTSSKLQIYTSGDVSITGKGTATNVVTTQDYSDSSSTTTTAISNVQPVKGKGKEKDTIIGWTYTQASTTATTINGTTTTKSSTNNYKVLIEAGATQPEAGTTTTTNAAGTYRDTGSYVGQPINLQIYGTRSDADIKDYGTQSFKISGNGSLSAVVYAPNADIEAKGGGNSGFVYGSLIGNRLKFTGNDCFYYDESLSDSDEGSRLGIEDWDEMVSYVDRSKYAPLMNF